MHSKGEGVWMLTVAEAEDCKRERQLRGFPDWQEAGRPKGGKRGFLIQQVKLHFLEGNHCARWQGQCGRAWGTV